jgi:hypothetical protein
VGTDIKKKQSRGKVIPLLAWTSPEGPRGLRIPELQDSRYMKVLRLSALYTGALLPPRRYQWYSFVSGSVDSRAVVRPEGLSK